MDNLWSPAAHRDRVGKQYCLESLKPTFDQDLNGDGVIGTISAAIEVAGSTSLTVVGNNYYFYDNNSGPSLKSAGSAILVGQCAPFAPIGAEQTAGGYIVAWKSVSADQYVVWSTDSSGNYLSSLTGTVSGSSTALETLEPTFHQDINGDGVIGLSAQHAGSTVLPNSLATTSDGIAQPLLGSATADTFVFVADLGKATNNAPDQDHVHGDYTAIVGPPDLTLATGADADHIVRQDTAIAELLQHYLGDFHLV